MNNPVTIRDAKLSDYETLCTIFGRANDFHCDLRPDYYRTVNTIISKKDFLLAVVAQQFKFGRKLVCVKIAEIDGKNIGAVFAVSVKRRALGWSKYDKEAILDNIYVDEEHRREGVGSALLNSVKDWSNDTGHEYLQTKIVDNNHESKKSFAKNGSVTDVVVKIEI